MAARHPKTVIGVVVSNKMDKTAVVQVSRLVQHPIYKKVVRQRRKFVAHDEKNVTKIGDHVRLSESRPLSKTKRWRIVQVLS